MLIETFCYLNNYLQYSESTATVVTCIGNAVKHSEKLSNTCHVPRVLYVGAHIVS